MMLECLEVFHTISVQTPCCFSSELKYMLNSYAIAIIYMTWRIHALFRAFPVYDVATGGQGPEQLVIHVVIM